MSLESEIINERPITVNNEVFRMAEYISRKGRANPLEISRDLKLPISTVYYYLKRYFIREDVFRFGAIVNLRKIGLRNAWLFIKGIDRLLYNKLISREWYDFWTYYSKVYDLKPLEFFMFSIPAGKEFHMRKLFERSKELGLIQDYRLIWLTDVYIAKWGFRWFENGVWKVKWEEWIRDIEISNENLPQILRNSAIVKTRLDNVDLEILRRLQYNVVLVKYSEIAKALNIPEHKVKYHYKNHLKRRDIFSTRLYLSPRVFMNYEWCLLELDFPGEKAMGRFVNSLENKPFSTVIYRVVNEAGRLKDSLFVGLGIPDGSIRGILRALDTLCEIGILRGFNTYLVDLNSVKKYTLPFNYYNININRWIFKYEEWLSELETLSEITRIPSIRTLK